MRGNRLPTGTLRQCNPATYEFFHGFSKELIILDDRYQWMLRHRGFSAPHTGVASASRLHAAW
jgi:hypothetical protein